ncbi:MAG: MASE3 domain-containing protein [Sulfuricurvum sp.]|nr:MASE3 domain-containing protein [Sulfuricurvum sp.]
MLARLVEKYEQCDLIGIIFPFFLIFGLIILRILEGFLLVHVLIELFSVIVGVIITVITYYMYKFTRNDFLRFLGIGFFWIAFFDLFHMISYYGMNVYSSIDSPNISTTLWIFARILEIATILIAPFVNFKKISSRLVFLFFGSVSILLYIATIMGLTPLMYIPHEGLTSTKIVLEYGVILFSFTALWMYHKKRNNFHPLMYQMIRASLVYAVLAECSFTLYSDIYGIMNFTGHIFKFLSYWMIFRGVVVTALKEPFSHMSKSANSYDTIPVPVVIVDSEGVIRQINQATLADNQSKMDDDILGHDNHDLLHPYGIEKEECEICKAIDQGVYSALEISYGELHKQYTISPIKTHDHITGTLQICTDVTDIRMAEKKLKEDQVFYETVFSSLNEAVIVLNQNTIVDCNKAALTLFETTRKNFIGKTIFETAYEIECREYALADYINSAYKGEYGLAECSLKLQSNDREPKIVEFTLSGFGENKNNTLIMIARDITRQTEEEKLFIMNARQAQMGEMISMIAHQWRQPLAIINAITTQMRLKALLSEIEDQPYIDNLIKIEHQSAHLSQTISDYRDFFRPDKPKEEFNITTLLNKAISLIDYTLKSYSIEIKQIIVHESILFTYRNEVLQVLIVLLKNALDKFVETKMVNGKITITVERDDRYCVVSVYDNAGGIPPDIINKLFVPYFTTKHKSQGTGLGLYMSKIIIQEHCQGEIEVFSQDQETIFSIKLPYLKEEK